MRGLIDEADTQVTDVPRWLDAPGDDGEAIPIPMVRGRLDALATRFSLSMLELAVLVLSMLPLFESRYGQLIAYLQGDETSIWPGVTLLVTLLGATPGSRITLRRTLSAPKAALLRHELVVPVDRSGRYSSRGDATSLRGTDTVFAFLTGESTPQHRALIDRGEWLPESPADPCVHIPEWRASAAHLETLCFGVRRAVTPIVMLQGGDGRDGLVARLAADAGMRVFVLNLRGLPEDAAEAWEVLRAALHLTRLTGSVLMLRHLPELEQHHPALLDAFDARVADHGQPIVVLTGADIPVVGFAGVPCVTITLPVRSRRSDTLLVQATLDALPHPVDPALDLGALLARTRINLDHLPQALAEAEQYRQLRDGTAPLAEADLHGSLRLRSQEHFGRLAQRIEPRRRLTDLIAGDALMEQLQEILAAIRHREAVLGSGFAHKVAYGTGISALFYGDSGTGKSMTAEVLAAELGVDLIRVDLATVVNKYIGETEKNLSKIFDRASADTGVLLFDEADALFGKRSEVRDARDRHANIEVSYLLQRLEHYPGLVVLSTNHRGHLDDAFTRRLTFMVRFDPPDAALRLKMWRAIWPDQVALAQDIDWDSFAHRTELTGAGIRNVALLASWLAAEAGRPVTQSDIERSIRRELSKTGRLVPQF
ncbi:ATP-binding protein [Burkholderia cenocepacia]|nr:ATP-binding protein [Burkholderia cenocepacia]